MAALPADPSLQEDPLDPERILRSLPERERETFLAEYRRAVEKARDPARWSELRRFLRLWAWRAVAVAEPGITRPGTVPGLARAGACCSRTRSGSIIPARELPADPGWRSGADRLGGYSILAPTFFRLTSTPTRVAAGDKFEALE